MPVAVAVACIETGRWIWAPARKPEKRDFPAKWSFDSTTAACLGAPAPDFVVYGTNVPGSGTQANIVALTNLYAGCGGQVPGFYWGYNTGGKVVTSPVLSLDGTQVAFTQTTGGTASLVLLKWAAGGTGAQNPGDPRLC